jgi:acetyl esterase/lipase
LAGAELLLAAELETGMMGAITGEIMAIGREAKAAAGDQIPVRDTARRDEHGHFTARYNAARKRKPGEEIAGPEQRTPIFIAAASDDELGFAPHSAEIYLKWLEAGQPAELHIYEEGGHGFGMRQIGQPVESWIDRFYEFLKGTGF